MIHAVRRRLAGLALAAALPLLAGCMSMAMVHGEPGTDLCAVRVGARLADVEARLGPPVRQWTTPAGVHYRHYHYDGGVPPDPAAVLLLPIDVLTLGLPSLIEQIDKKLAAGQARAVPPSQRRLLAVAYNADGEVLGVFVNVGEFDPLPVDGRAPAPAPR